MIGYLILSILTSTGLFLILKSFHYRKIDTLHGIAFNYWAAASLAFATAPSKVISHSHELLEYGYIPVIIGGMFIVVFYITGITTQKLGVATASVASKMSMVIPVAAGVFLYHESMGLQKITGILFAIPAVILVSRSGDNDKVRGSGFGMIGLPLLLFIGAGLVDTSIKFTQHHFMNDSNRQLVIGSIFLSAGIFGMLRVLYEVIFLRKKVLLISIAGGILLGITNYLSLYFLLKCLAAPGSESSTVFAYVNIGVVLTSFISGMLLFGERPERLRLIGVVLSIIAITILSGTL